jgi:Domain of unknown function (DUF5666)
MSTLKFFLSVSAGFRWVLLAGIVLAIVVAATGCGGGSSMNPGSGLGSVATQVRIGDAPADRVIAFEVSVGPITMTPSGGVAFTVLAGTQRVELTHLSGTSEPLALVDVPQGNYTSMSITLSNPEVTFINNSGAVVKLEPPLNQAVTINLSPALTVGASASVVNIDLNLANLLTFDSQGNVSGVSPIPSAFTVSTSAVAAQNNGDQEEAENGELEDITGMVTSVSGTSFAMTVGQSGVSLKFATDGNTEFKDGASLSTLLNTIVKVEGVTKPDGTLYAKQVEGIENQNGAELEGVITQVTGNPATQLVIVAQDGIGSGMDDAKVGSMQTVNVTGAQYRVDQGHIDTSGIGGLPSPPNFPFDATTIHAGQRVETESSETMNGGSIVAEKVKLQQQALTGTVSGLSGPTSAGPATFTLTVGADSAIAMLSGQTTVTVFWQPGTNLHELTSVNNGDRVRVRGLVFFTGSSFNMIARRIDP